MVSGRPSKPSGVCKIDRGHDANQRREKRQSEQLENTGKRPRRYLPYDHADPNSPVNVLRDIYLASDGKILYETLSQESEERVGVHVPRGAIHRAVKNENLGKPGRPPELTEDEEKEIVRVRLS